MPKENQKGRRCPQGMKAPVGLLSRRPVCKANAACSARQGLRYFRGAGRRRVAAPCVCFVPCAALASCRPLPQQLLPVSAAGRGRRRCKTKGCSPLIIPKQMGSIQKIQVAALEDFCVAPILSRLRDERYGKAACFSSKTVICKLFMNPIDKVGKQEYSFSSRTDRVLKQVKPVRQEVLETVKQLKNSRCFPFGSISAPDF